MLACVFNVTKETDCMNSVAVLLNGVYGVASSRSEDVSPRPYYFPLLFALSLVIYTETGDWHMPQQQYGVIKHNIVMERLTRE